MEDYSTDFVIDIKQFIAYIMRKWLVIALVCIACMGAMAYLGSKKTTTYSVERDFELEGKIDNYKFEIEKKESYITSFDDRMKKIDEIIKEYDQKLEELNNNASESDSLTTQDAIVNITIKRDSLYTDWLSYLLQKENAITDISSYSSQIDRVKEQFKSVHGMNYDDYLKAIDAEPQVVTASKKTIVKYAIIGAVVGVFFGIVLVCLRYFTNGKMKDIDCFKKVYGISILRMIYPYTGKKRCWYNRLIDKLEGYVSPKKSEEEEYDIVAGKISMVTCENADIVITGTCNVDVLKAVAEKLSKSSNKMQVSYNVIANPAESAVHADQLKDKYVLVVENKNNLSASAIDSMVDALKFASCKIVGAVLI